MTQTPGAESSTPTSQNFFEGKSQTAVESAIKGDNPHLFRVAEAVHDSTATSTPSVRVEGPVARTVAELTELSPTFLAHEAVTKRPFSASYFKIDKVYSSLSESERGNFRAIDSYIQKKVESGKFIDSADSAASIIRSIEQKLNLKDNHDPYYKAERIAKYLSSTNDYFKHKVIKARLAKAEEQKQSELKAQKEREFQIRREAERRVLMRQNRELMEQKEKARMALLKLAKGM